MKALVKILATHSIFADLSTEEMLSFEKIVDQQKCAKDSLLFDISTPPEYLYYIESGSFLLLLANSEDILLKPGQVIGEIGVINGDFRSGTVRALEDSSVIRICGTGLFNEEHIPAKTSLKVVRSLSKRITNYLRSKLQIPTRELIAEGETDHVEFKSTLRRNLHTDKKDKKIENASLKTVAAFLNSDGGTLLIGVKDDGSLLDLEADGFESNDKMLLHLSKIINERLGTLCLKFIHIHLETIDGKQVLRIDCNPSSQACYLIDGQSEHFYIRSGPATIDLSVSALYPYIRQRFFNEST